MRQQQHQEASRACVPWSIARGRLHELHAHTRIQTHTQRRTYINRRTFLCISAVGRWKPFILLNTTGMHAQHIHTNPHTHRHTNRHTNRHTHCVESTAYVEIVCSNILRYKHNTHQHHHHASLWHRCAFAWLFETGKSVHNHLPLYGKSRIAIALPAYTHATNTHSKQTGVEKSA